MRLKSIAIAGALLCATSIAFAHQEGKPARSAMLEKFKSLAGDWVHKAGDKEVAVNYKVTSGGSAVVETDNPGSGHEMITVITADGDGLALTHYCMLNNQPQMRAAGGQTGKSIAFKFTRATNMKSEKDMHMRNVTYTFVNRDTLKSTWELYNGGKSSGEATFEHIRKK